MSKTMKKTYNPSEKQKNCLYALPYTGDDFAHTYCLNGKTLGKIDDNCEVCNEDCEKCQKYKSRYIEYPIQVNRIEFEKPDRRVSKRAGKFVKVRPCNEKYGGKTYLGMFLGEQQASIHVFFDDENGILKVNPITNPAIYVFELREVIFGMESWWSIVDNPNDIKDITEQDIDNVWYVQLLKAMSTVEGYDCNS